MFLIIFIEKIIYWHFLVPAMQKIVIKLLKIGSSNFSLRDKDFDIKIDFEVNGKQKSYYNHYKLTNPELLTERLIKEIKEKEKSEADKIGGNAYDPLGGISIITIEKLEDTEKKLTNFFSKVDYRIKQFKNVKTSENYISHYDRFKEFEVQLF